MIRIGAKLSKTNSGAVLYDSDAGRVAHEAVGFDRTKSIVFPNGVDSGKFMPNRSLRDEVRAKLGITPDAIVIGHVAGGVLRGCLVGALVTIIALFFTKLDVQYPLVTLSIVLLSSIVFALAGFINAIFARKFDDISIVPTFVLTPLTYLGGVFYSISLLPEPWKTMSLANPILYMVNAFRYGILDKSDIDIVTAYAILFVFIVLLFSACMLLMRRGVGIRE